MEAHLKKSTDLAALGIYFAFTSHKVQLIKLRASEQALAAANFSLHSVSRQGARGLTFQKAMLTEL